MEAKDVSEIKNNTSSWASHALVAVIMVVTLVVLLTLQPWSGSAITIVNSFRMNVFSTMSDGEEYAESAQEFEYSVPSSFHVTTTVSGMKQELIVIGRDIYTSERMAAGFSMIQAIIQGLDSLKPGEEHSERTLAELDDSVELENTEIDGVVCRHYRGRMDFVKDIEEQIAGLDPEDLNYDIMLEALEQQIEVMSKIKTNIEVWVSKEDGLVRRMSYEAEVPSEDGGRPYTQSTLLRYYDINTYVIIEAPVDSSGELLPGWYQVSF
jgi:hypothetical protein